MTTDARPLDLTRRRQILQLRDTGTLVIEKLVRPQPGKDYVWVGWIFDTTGSKTKVGKAEWVIPGSLFGDAPLDIRSPWGSPGQRFWVREALDLWPGSLCYSVDGEPVFIHDWEWFENHTEAECKARNMPRWASRYALTLTSIAVIQRDGWRWVGTFEQVS